MSRGALEKTAVRLLKSRMEQKNGVQELLMGNGILFKVQEMQNGLPEIISEDTFVEILKMQDDQLPSDIMDEGWEIDDIDDDGLTMM